MPQIFKKLYVHLLTLLCRSQEYGHSLNACMATRSSSGLGGDLYILFLEFLQGNFSCITLPCCTCFLPFLAIWFQA